MRTVIHLVLARHHISLHLASMNYMILPVRILLAIIAGVLAGVMMGLSFIIMALVGLYREFKRLLP